MVAGEADAAIVDAVSLALFTRVDGRLRSVGQPLRTEPYVVVMPMDAPQLRTRVNEALAVLAADGTLAALKARWMSVSSN